MKAFRNFVLGCGLMTSLGWISADCAMSQTLTTLHDFSANSNSTNSDGAEAFASLVLSSNTLYGTSPVGGAAGHGTVFKVNTDGTGFATVHSFSGAPAEGATPLSE